MAYTARQIRTQTAIRKAISRTNKLYQTFGEASEQYHKQATILSKMGIQLDPEGFKYNAKEAAKMEISDAAIKNLQGFRTAKEELTWAYKQLHMEYVGVKLTEAQKQEAIQFVAERKDMHDFIVSHVDAVYDWELKNNNYVARHKGNPNPSWDDLIKMKNDILAGGFGAYEEADNREYPEE